MRSLFLELLIDKRMGTKTGKNVSKLRPSKQNKTR